MDSLSQFALGAAVGEAVLGKKIGNKAIWLGGLLGTLPDLDVLFTINDPIQQILLHRGISHSIFGVAVATPILAYIFQWFHKRSRQKQIENGTQKHADVTLKAWLLFTFLALVTHPILDAFTSYGTQLFLPFTDYRVAFDSIFVADPLYTIPLCLGLLVCLFLNRENPRRRFWNRLGLILSTGYLMFSLVNKQMVNSVMKNSLADQGIQYERYMSYPSPLNQVLWASIAETEDAYYIGSYSHFDKDKDVEFTKIVKDKTLRTPLEGSKNYEILKWFSNGFYVLSQKDDHIEYADLRFGPMNVWKVDRDAYEFVFKIKDSVDGIFVEQENVAPEFEGGFGNYAAEFWRRIKGV